MEILKNNKELTVSDVVAAVESIAPAELQETWDNSGIMVGFHENTVNKVLTCLEINEDVLEEAKRLGADMIVTHHPLIFSGIKSLCTCNYKDRMVLDLIKSGISVYSCHTPFDKVKGGNNDIIAEKLGLTEIKNLKGEEIENAVKMAAKSDEADIGRTGILKDVLTLKDVIQLAASKLNVSVRQIRVTGNLNRTIHKVGLCTGAGSDLMGMAVRQGCQLFITGDVKYHEAQTALEEGICLIDAGHYGTEKFFGEEMQKKLQKKLGNSIEIIASKTDIDPFKII